MVSKSSGVRRPDIGRGCTHWTEVPCQLLEASRQDTKPYGCNISMLSIDTVVNTLDLRFAFTPVARRHV